MRAQIRTTEDGHVTLIAIHPLSGEPIDREYTAPASGGYVYEIDDRGQLHQVCERLAPTGNTLYCTRAQLPALIRQEWATLRREARRHQE